MLLGVTPGLLGGWSIIIHPVNGWSSKLGDLILSVILCQRYEPGHHSPAYNPHLIMHIISSVSEHSYSIPNPGNISLSPLTPQI